MILYLVDELGRMLQPDAHGDALGLYVYARIMQVAVDVAGRMAGRQYHRAVESELCSVGETHCAYALYGVAGYEQARHLGLKVHLAATPYYIITHVFYHPWQLVGAYMGMSIGQDRR